MPTRHRGSLFRNSRRLSIHEKKFEALAQKAKRMLQNGADGANDSDSAKSTAVGAANNTHVEKCSEAHDEHGQALPPVRSEEDWL